MLPSFESAIGNTTEPKVLDLNQSVSALHEAMLNAISNSKAHNIFEGLGEVMAKSLVNQTRNIEIVDEIAVRKTIRDITMLKYNIAAMLGASQVTLEKTVHYYELLLCTPKVNKRNKLVLFEPKFYLCGENCLFAGNIGRNPGKRC